MVFASCAVKMVESVKILIKICSKSGIGTSLSNSSKVTIQCSIIFNLLNVFGKGRTVQVRQ